MTYEIKRALKSVHRGDINALQKYLQDHPDGHWSDLRYTQTGQSVLHVAAQLGHLEILKMLLATGNNFVDCRDNYNKTALHEAAANGHVDSVGLLLQHNACVDALKISEWTPLMLSIGSSNLPVIQLLLENGASVNYANKDGWTVLHLVARDGDVGMLTSFIRYGLELDRRTKNGRSALQIACLHHNTSVVDQLIRYGVDVNSCDSSGKTPLYETVINHDVGLFEMVREAGGDWGVKDNTNNTLLHTAATVGNLWAIERIVGVIEVDCENSYGFTPLHCACKSGQIKAYELLVTLGADCVKVDGCGRTPKEYLRDANIL